MLSADVTAPLDPSLNTVVPLYLNNNSLSPVSNDIAHLLDPYKIAWPFVSRSPPNCGVRSLTKSVGTAETFAFEPVPSAKTIAEEPAPSKTSVPLPSDAFASAGPCLILAICAVVFFIKNHFCWSLGVICKLNWPLGDPDNTMTF